jgi:hypothetical protein
MANLNKAMLEQGTIKSYLRDFKTAEMNAASEDILILYIMCRG